MKWVGEAGGAVRGRYCKESFIQSRRGRIRGGNVENGRTKRVGTDEVENICLSNMRCR